MTRVLVGDCRAQLRTLPAASVHCVITSPPYYGLRDYKTEPQVWGGGFDGCEHVWGDALPPPPGRGNKPGDFSTSSLTNPARQDTVPRAASTGQFCHSCGAWRGHLGLEPTPELYVQHLVEVFAEVSRVLRDDGTLWLNLGDSYYGPAGGYNAKYESDSRTDGRSWGGTKDCTVRTNQRQKRPAPPRHASIKTKDLIGVPWMTAFALREAGWYLRMDNIWAKSVSGQKELLRIITTALIKAKLSPDTITRTLAQLEPYVGSCMPEAVKDRATRSHEYVFLLTKRPRYFHDGVAVQEQGVFPAGTTAAKGSRARSHEPGVSSRPPEYATYTGTRNRRSVWIIPPRPFKGAHFATFGPDLVEPLILAGTSSAGCCASCGAPYVRITTRRTYRDAAGTRAMAKTPLNVIRAGWRTGDPRDPREAGWHPSCTCGAAVVPCTVLDPFGGSGTVAAVAEDHDRSAISIELNPEYAAMYERRRKDVRRALRRTVRRSLLGVP